MQIHDALEGFLLQLEANGRSRHTIQQYRRHVGLLAAWLAPRDDLGAIDSQAIARFLVSPQASLSRQDGKPKKATSSNALRGSLKGFFGYLAAAGILERDPSRLIQRARCGPPPPRSLDENDQKALMHVLEQATSTEGRRDHVLFRLMLGSGIRVGSAVGLDAQDVDLDRGELRLQKAKGDRVERVFFPKDLTELLRQHLAGRNRGAVFTGSRGERLTTRHVGRRLKGWLQKAKIVANASPHTLRHSFATGLYRKTGEIALVKEALCHRAIASTLIYARIEPERLRAAVGG